MSGKTKTIVSLVIAFVCLIVLLIINPFVVVRAGTKGLVFKWGAIQDTVLEQGLHFRMPIAQKVEKVSVQPLSIEYEIAVGGDGAITKDNQTVGAQVIVFYKYDQARLVEMRRDYGEEKLENLIKTGVKESVKETIGDYSIFDIAQNQEEIRIKTWEKIVAKSAKYPIELTELRLQNYDWADDFDAQIRATSNKAQQVKQAEQELLITEQQANKKVKEAEADRAALIAQAEGERDAAKLRAEAKALEGEGIRKYNESLRSSVDLEVRIRQLEIEKIKAERWDGKYVPENHYGPIPFSMGGLQGQ